MLGAVIGDIAGSPYELEKNNIKTTDFPLFGEKSHFTDDSVMTLAVAQGLMEGYKDKEASRTAIIHSMQMLGRRYIHAGYGGNFIRWLLSNHPKPYNSFGNGSAMRVSSVGWLYPTLSETEDFAALTASVSHNHPEGIRGAQAAAAAVYLARTQHDKSEIRAYITEHFGYDLSRTCDEIRPDYHFEISCQGTMPAAFAAFLDGKDYENTIRLAVSLGGDSDTIAAIAGGMAEAYFGIPKNLKQEGLAHLPEDLQKIWYDFQDFLQNLS